MIRSNNVIESNCYICRSPFYKRGKAGKLRLKGMINKKSIRPVKSVTCCKNCSKIWTHQSLKQRNKIMNELKKAGLLEDGKM